MEVQHGVDSVREPHSSPNPHYCGVPFWTQSLFKILKLIMCGVGGEGEVGWEEGEVG